MSNIIIAPATIADYAEILVLNEDAIPAVNSIPEEKLARLHRQSAYLGVARDPDGTMAGFLLALPETAEYESTNFGFFKRGYERFVYIDRIVVSARHRRAGIGQALYEDLTRQVPGDCPMLACEVNLRPPNPSSIAFHQRLGFAAVGEQDSEGGLKRVCMMAKPLHRAATA